LLSKALELTKIIEDKIKAIQHDVRASFELLNAAAEKSRVEVTTLFNEIRKAVNERETALKQKIAEQKLKEEMQLKEQEDRLSAHYQSILTFYSEFERTIHESDNKLLSASLARLDLIKKATANVENLDFYIPFNEINKDIELNFLWKSLSPNKNPNAQTMKNSNQNANPSRLSGNAGYNNNNFGNMSRPKTGPGAGNAGPNSGNSNNNNNNNNVLNLNMVGSVSGNSNNNGSNNNAKFQTVGGKNQYYLKKPGEGNGRENAGYSYGELSVIEEYQRRLFR
jgi:hypothetical protein